MPFSSTDRFVRHITELVNSLESHPRAILLTCFIYGNPGFKVMEKTHMAWRADRSAAAFSVGPEARPDSGDL